MTSKKFKSLFSPLQIGKYTLKNRVIASPHSGGPNLYRAGDDGFSNFTETAAQYTAGIARGGAAIVNTGHLGVDPRYMLGSNQETFNFYGHSIHEHVLPVMHMMTDMVHAYGSLASIELNHCGHYGTAMKAGDPLLGPIDTTSPKGKPVRAMTKEDMEEVVQYFVNAAVIGKRGGFDVVNIHAAHAWLIGSFFSPLTNLRTDEFGGNWENRAKFPMMIIKAVHEAVGKDMLIAVRFSVNEIFEGGITLDDAAKTIELMSDYVDIVQCSAGKVHNPMATSYMIPMPYMDHGINAWLCKEMKDRIGNKVVFEAIGGINDPEMANKLVEEGTVDLVGMARSFIADPDWAEKARQGKEKEIRPCIRCLRCLNYANPPQTGTSQCTVNPYRIMPHPLAPSQFKHMHRVKNVAVIGGGAAGMKAAVELSKKGHSVTIFEKSDKLGGVLHFADHVQFKEDLKRYREYLIHMVNTIENIKIELNTEATSESIKDKYDSVVVAIGANKFMPPVEGVDGKNVCHAVDMFGNEDKLGDTVAIIGGGFVGCEAGVHLITKGKKVVIIEMTDELIKDGKEIEEEKFLTEYFLTHELDMSRRDTVDVKEIDSATIYLNSKCTKVTKEGVYVEQDGKEIFISADSVVMSTGFRPDCSKVESYRESALDYVAIGDCKKVADILNTTFGGHSAGLQI